MSRDPIIQQSSFNCQQYLFTTFVRSFKTDIYTLNVPMNDVVYLGAIHNNYRPRISYLHNKAIIKFLLSTAATFVFPPLIIYCAS